jgi:hypothetical protein
MRSFLLNLFCFSFTIGIVALAQTSHVQAVPCRSVPNITSLRTIETKRVLAIFGYDLHQPYDCTKLTSPWYGASTVLLFRSIPTQLDDRTRFSVVFTSRPREIWVVPIASGMLEYPRVESDPHNLASFNALLAVQKAPTTEPEWISVSQSYLALIGHEAGLAPRVSCAARECSVEISEQPSADALILWTLVFSTTGQLARLEDVSRELQPTR